MVFYARRKKFDRLSFAVGKIFARVLPYPNAWTLSSIAFASFSAWFIMKNDFMIASIFFAVAVFVDFVDGSVARFVGKVTKKGAYIDTITDRYVEFIVIFALLFADIPQFILPSEAWILLYAFGSFMTTYTKAAAKEKDLTKDEIRGGILERGERVAILFLGLMLASTDVTYLSYTLVILSVLSNVTSFQRIYLSLSK